MDEAMVELDDRQSTGGNEPELPREGGYVFFSSHQHRLEYVPGSWNTHETCSECHKVVPEVLTCHECDYFLCIACFRDRRVGSIVPIKDRKVNVLLSIVGGCWNRDLLCKSIKTYFKLQFSSDGIESPIEAYDIFNKRWLPISDERWGERPGEYIPYAYCDGINGKKWDFNNYLEGTITQPIKFRIRNLTNEQFGQNLNFQIWMTDADMNKHYRVVCPDFTDIALDFDIDENKKKALRFWHSVPLGSMTPDFTLVPEDKRESYNISKIPYLYADAHDAGFLNLELKVTAYDDPDPDFDNVNTEKTKNVDDDPEYSPCYIDDINVLKMIVKNRIKWSKFSKYLTADIYKTAFEIYLSMNWRYLLPTCITVLASLNEEIHAEAKRPGNWDLVKTQCEEVVAKLLNYMPDDSEAKNYDILKEELLERHPPDQYYDTMVENEMKVFPSNDSFFTFVNQIWEEKRANIWPFNWWVSPTTIWKTNLLFFIIFLSLFTYHIYGINQSAHIDFYGLVDGSLGFDDVTNYETYTDWFNNTLIPFLYTPDKHTYLLTDSVFVRLIRVPPGPCDNPEEIPFVTDEVELCYPRLDNTLHWSPGEWQNFQVSNDLGKTISTDNAFYEGKGAFLVLGRNKSDADAILSTVDFDNWLDWSIQAVIVEYVLYSPNLEIFATCASVAEFSNIGTFQGNTECAIISPSQLYDSRSPVAIVLYLFFLGFFVEELYELLLFITKRRYPSKEEQLEAEDKCDACCAPFQTLGCCACDGSSSTIAVYIYLNDLWNILDIIMIVFGGLGLILCNYAANTLQSFNIQELWTVTLIQQISNIFLSIAIVIAYLRFLDYLTYWEFIGSIVLTIFKMMFAIGRFIISFVLIVIGFSSAFHILYDNNPTYNSFPTSILSTGISIFAGYDIPGYTNLLAFPVSYVGYTLQVALIILGVVLLVNFLIAMMSTIYEEIQSNSTEEYRWLVTGEVVDLNYVAWPVPLNLVQFFLFAPIYTLKRCCGVVLANPVQQVEVKSKEVKERNTELKTSLYCEMTVGYFRETLPESEYKSAVRFHELEKKDPFS